MTIFLLAALALLTATALFLLPPLLRSGSRAPTQLRNGKPTRPSCATNSPNWNRNDRKAIFPGPISPRPGMN